jgi:dolichol-phosphate mannosyltransferase
LSVVIPVLDEEDNLPELHRALTEVLSGLGTYEIVFVDDGSEDSSAEIVLDLAERDPSVKLVRFSRNFGHQAALSAGLDHAAGQAVVFMDADLQDPPQLLVELVEQWQAGGEVVYAIRTKRQAPPLKRAAYFLFYRLFQRLAEMDVPLDSGAFCLMDRRVADAIRSLPERNRFLPGLRSWVGFRQVGVPYDRPERRAGEAKYTTRRLVKLALDGLLSFSSFPLRLASYLGFFTSALGVLYTLFAVFARLFVGELPAGWTSTIAILLTVSGVQLIMTGVLGEYLARTYEETKGRPLYVVRDAHGVRRRV